MKEYNRIFEKMSLFKEIPRDKYENVFRCLQAHVKEYGRGETVVGINSRIENAGIVLSGKLSLILYSRYGSEHNLLHFTQGSLFGETLTCALEENNSSEVIAVEKSKILFLRFSQLYTPKAKTCPYASQIALNLLQEFSKRNILLNKKVEIG